MALPEQYCRLCCPTVTPPLTRSAWPINPKRKRPPPFVSLDGFSMPQTSLTSLLARLRLHLSQPKFQSLVQNLRRFLTADVLARILGFLLALRQEDSVSGWALEGISVYITQLNELVSYVLIDG